MWLVQPMEIAGPNGEHTGRWRMTATSDEGGGGPHGDTSHDHANPIEARQCERCDEYCSRIAGMPSKKARQETEEAQSEAWRQITTDVREVRKDQWWRRVLRRIFSNVKLTGGLPAENEKTNE